MKDTILVDTAEGRVEITVQTKDGAAHSALSRHDNWQQARGAIQWLVAGVLKDKEQTC